MTDQNLPVDLTSEEAKAAREWAADYLKGLYEVAPATVARIVLDTVPEPPLPTMNKLPENERYDCLRMQCDVHGFTDRMVIVNIRSSSVDVMAEDGERWTIEDIRVTPRPDLPPMMWPGTEKPAPAPALPDGWRLADHEKHGRVLVVTNPTPDRYGHVYFVLPDDDDTMGYDWHFCHVSKLTYLDQEDDTPTAPDHLAVGSEWDDLDALARACDESGRNQIAMVDKDGDVFVWGTDEEWWEPGLPGRDYAPFTIIYTGKKTDQ